MWRAFAEASLVDEAVLYMAPAPDGRRADEVRALRVLQPRLGPMSLALVEQRHMDPDTMWRFRRAAVKEGS
jgi:riboflavin biosynthesis pyrimidine reductase